MIALPTRSSSSLASLFILLSLTFANTTPVVGQVPENQASRLSSQDWRDDLRFLASQMKLKHKSLFHAMTETEFSQAVEKFDADIPQLNEDQIFVRFAQLMALVQDGHSGFNLRPFPPSEAKDHIPVRFARYADGIYVRAAAPEYSDAVGGKVIKVGSVGWKEAMQRVDSVESYDAGNNGEQLAWSAKTLLNWPRVLHGLGLSDSPDSADLLIEKNGQNRTFTMKASAPMGDWYVNSLPSGWVDARPNSIPAPLSVEHADKFYWFEYLPIYHAIYFQFNLVINGEGETLADFSKRLGKALDHPGVERLIIDLRNNTGGDNTLLRPLLVTLFRSKVNHRGGMYTLIGPTTFSAAQNFVNRLENYAEVIYVGEPTAENVNFYGDPAGISLPHSHLEAAVSQLWWQDKDPRDRRTATNPEIAASTNFQDYLKGQDPVLQLALTTGSPLAIEEFLEQGLAEGVDATTERYQAYVNDPIHRYISDPESRVDALGYKFLSAKRNADAITIFEVNARVHPNSANAYDSLGEAYAAANDKQRAINAYRKSLELNPANTNAKQVIDRLETAR